MPFTWNTKEIHMILLQYKLMRRIRRNVKRSVNNSRSIFILHSHKVSATHRRKKQKVLGGQSCPTEDSTEEFTTPTLEELPTEYRQAYEELRRKRTKELEAWRKKQAEEDLKAFENDLQDFIKSTLPRDNQAETVLKQEEEALQIDGSHGEKMNDSESMVTSVVEAELDSTCAESTESKEASFIDQEHGMASKTAVIDFSGCKGVYMLPYEFCAKGIDEHQVESISKQSSVDIEHQSSGA